MKRVQHSCHSASALEGPCALALNLQTSASGQECTTTTEAFDSLAVGRWAAVRDQARDLGYRVTKQVNFCTDSDGQVSGSAMLADATDAAAVVVLFSESDQYSFLFRPEGDGGAIFNDGGGVRLGSDGTVEAVDADGELSVSSALSAARFASGASSACLSQVGYYLCTAQDYLEYLECFGALGACDPRMLRTGHLGIAAYATCAAALALPRCVESWADIQTGAQLECGMLNTSGRPCQTGSVCGASGTCEFGLCWPAQPGDGVDCSDEWGDLPACAGPPGLTGSVYRSASCQAGRCQLDPPETCDQCDVCYDGICQPASLPCCGDGGCDLLENCSSCAADCGVCAPSCAPGSIEPCYSGPSNTQGVGACRAGTRVCNPNGSGWSSCSGQVTPMTESDCNLVDEDCNGADRCLTCTPGSQRSCYSGPAATQSIGTCRNGIQTCDSLGSGWGSCVGEITPRPEICGNSIDETCSGADVPCQSCPNGIREGTEQCDGSDFGGASCSSRGYCSGVLTCLPGCSVGTSACVSCPQLPPAPLNPTAAPLAYSSVALAWTDPGGSLDAILIERRAGAGGFAQIATAAPGIGSFVDVGLTGSISYGYRVRGHNSAGYGPYSPETPATTMNCLQVSNSGMGTNLRKGYGTACTCNCSSCPSCFSCIVTTLPDGARLSSLGCGVLQDGFEWCTVVSVPYGASWIARSKVIACS